MGDGLQGVVDVATTVAASPNDVWRAIADEEVRAGWWDYLELDAVSGGRFEERWEDVGGRPVRTYGRVIDAVPGKLLRLSWQDDGWPEATEVEIRVDAAEAGTTVRVVHAGWERLPDGEDLARQHRAGWSMHLENLRGFMAADPRAPNT